jgi:hypothetical protein
MRKHLFILLFYLINKIQMKRYNKIAYNNKNFLKDMKITVI